MVVVAVAACKKEAAAVPHPGAPTPVTVAAPALIELTRSVPVRITVSSQVNNPKILPAHLVDGDLNTAWNSATGDLVGAWIDVSPAAGTLAELRLTVGHTGHSAKGEDYFTMNPRIKRVHVEEGTRTLGVFPLDVTSRALQTIKVRASGTVRIVVDEIVSGSKAGWREICISELEAWGAPPSEGWIAPTTPLVPTIDVYQPPPDPAAGPCAETEAAKLAWERARKDENDACLQLDVEQQRRCGVDPPGEPTCSSSSEVLDPVAPPWSETAQVVCETRDSVYGQSTCTIAVASTAGKTMVEIIGSAKLGIEAIHPSVEDVVPGGDRELVLRIAVSGNGYTTGERPGPDAFIAVCRTQPMGCTDPVGTQGADWSVKARFQNGKLITTRLTGDPPATSLVNAPLVFK